MLSLAIAVWDVVTRRAAELELTAPQVKTLLALRSLRGVNMSSLAGALGYDPSSVTTLCDRLQARGLLERRTDERDRRSRTVLLTPAGARLTAELIDRLGRPPDGLALEPADATRLRELLQVALAGLTE